MINKLIDKLVGYAIENGLIEAADRIYAVNSLLSIMGEDAYTQPEDKCDTKDLQLHEILDALCDIAAEKGLCGETVNARDLFDTKLMGALTPRPSEVIREFNELYRESPEKATDKYFALSKATNYIRTDRIKKDMRWKVSSSYGEIDITVNLSKPEKDPRDIAAAKSAPQSGYPKCLLCHECEGYAGRINFPARQNHRVIPIKLGGSDWFMQYSPYVYYDEHCIAFNSMHTPMSISAATFERLLDFVTVFPHYFIGSNADLPIVGGSILSHDHFQGGRYDFAMAKADIKIPLVFEGFENVSAGIVRWPMSVIRLTGKREEISELSSKILSAWRGYSDESAYIFAQTDGVMHNTITPIARRHGNDYELDLVLRNNITTIEYPMGLYHPHAEYHHIKKENIGLIEVMGLAVLPSRLKNEISAMKKYLLGNASEVDVGEHKPWLDSILEETVITEKNAENIIKEEIGKVFVKVLECAGVYKDTPEGEDAFLHFTSACGAKALED